MTLEKKTEKSQPKLIVVSNRLPVTISKTEKGYGISLSSGGLVTALAGLKKEMSFTWVGWPGQDFDEAERVQISELLKEKSCVPVFMDEETADLHYNGFSNSILWPLFHYHPGEINFEQSVWEAYKRANRAFAEVVIGMVNKGDIVWVHDYHLMLLCQMLREGLGVEKYHVKVGWFLHTPFPSSEIYRILPVRQEILEGVLAADMVGFHTYDYARHFLSSCTRILGLPSNSGGVEVNGRAVKVGTFPIGIDPELIIQEQRKPKVQKRLEEFKRQFEGKQVIVGVDRLDYIKGVPQKFLAYENFLETHPEYVGKVVLVQVAVPSRGVVEEYQQLVVTVNELVGSINGKYGTVEYTPIHFLHKSIDLSELVALYTISDVCLVTSTRDGMNLVSYEYVACQGERHGVLMLSEFAGAAQSLNGSLIVNPWNIAEVGNALHEALSMDPERRKSNYKTLSRYVNKFTAAYWGVSFVKELKATMSDSEDVLRILKLTPKVAGTKFSQAKGIRPIIINYDGTLSSTQDMPDFATPSPEILMYLDKLTKIPDTLVYIFSGRTRAQLEKWFEGIDVGLIAEHGCFYKHPSTFAKYDLLKNSMSPNLDIQKSESVMTLGSPVCENNGWFRLVSGKGPDWHDSVLPLFRHYTERTPGSFIEQKEIDITWHYRMADPEFGLWQANELQMNLEKVLAHMSITIILSNKTLELQPTNISSASTIKHVLTDIVDKYGPLDFLLVGCKSKIDEPIFTFIKDSELSKDIPNLLTFTVGLKKTEALYFADHAHNGGDIEVMGLLQGKVQGTSIVVMDVFALPVEGTETRVNAQQEAYEYMVRYLENSKKVGREENVIGWYHSHPGYGCWLSGIDVNTQKLNQRYQDPWLAIVDYSPDIPTSRKADSLPSEKIEDFGMHSNMYYQLDVSYFKSNIDKQVLDSIWTQYWGNALSKKITTTHTKSLELKIRAEAEKLEILADSTPPSAPKDQVYGGKLANFPVVM
ncbi:Alpha,alpha-trehalose-phosphate synthase [UDP-forming] A [Zancudomyces culisetae]|uniref:COP9 signalosome complex subunit 5 n=1 Tax=Zancudomyces culisetae TaxID=1213189 RepID=A0A1R1PMG0_ZANCU|nr:Alpha,alpha-trehalose-phosphate synthase [UDP-forming] A [Zancudomyces culisetae]|eukprot:OMH82072.1 Alpha,alpha-trehalose-phosphate synthase [UDP-forming] A [Zancudomyces culisetae]